MKKAYGILFISLLLTACFSANNIKEESLPIDKILNLNTKVIRNAPFDEIFTIEQTHILNHSEFIPSLDKAISTSNYIFAIDKYKANKLYKLRKEGGITKVIGSEGEGPGEYLDMVDFDVIEKENQVIIADNSNGFIKLLYYDLEGVFIREHLFEGITADYFAVLKDGNLLFHTEGQCYEEQCYDFVITNQKGEILSKYSKTPPILSEYWIEQHKPLFRTEDGRIIATSYSDAVIFIFESAKKLKKLQTGNEDQIITKSFLNKMNIEDEIFEGLKESFKFYFIENPIQIGEYISFSLEYRGNYITAFHNLVSDENYIIHSFTGGISNLNTSFKIIGADGDKLILLIDSEYLLANNSVEQIEEKFNIDYEKLDHPIIIIADLNKPQ